MQRCRWYTLKPWPLRKWLSAIALQFRAMGRFLWGHGFNLYQLQCECLAAPNQSWQISRVVLWWQLRAISLEIPTILTYLYLIMSLKVINFTGNPHNINISILDYECENDKFKIIFVSPYGQWVKSSPPRAAYTLQWNWISIGSGNGLSPIHHQAITWTSAYLLFTVPLGTNFTEIRIKTQNFSLTKMLL